MAAIPKNQYRITPVILYSKTDGLRGDYLEVPHVAYRNHLTMEQPDDFDARVRTFEFAMMALGDFPVKEQQKAIDDQIETGEYDDWDADEAGIGNSGISNYRRVRNTKGAERNPSLMPECDFKARKNVQQLEKKSTDKSQRKEDMGVYFAQVKKLVVKNINSCNEQMSIVLRDNVVGGAEIKIKKDDSGIAVEWMARTDEAFNFLNGAKGELQRYLNEKLERTFTVSVNYRNYKTRDVGLDVDT